MKDRHINIETDSILLKLLHTAVQQKLKPKPLGTAILLVLKFVFYFSLLIICYYSIFATTTLIFLLLGYIGFGLIAVLLGFNFAHDFSHNTVFKNKTLNNF